MENEKGDQRRREDGDSENYIWVLGSAEGTEDRELSGPGRGGYGMDRGFGDNLAQSLGLKRTKVYASHLAEELHKFMGAMDSALDKIPGALKNYDLDEIELTVEINAEGGVSLLGTGGKLGGSSGIMLKLVRQKPPKTSEDEPPAIGTDET